MKKLVNNKEASFSIRYYDESDNRLVYIGESATPEMWDNLWAPDEQTVRDALKPARGTKWVIKLTRHYLASGAGRILEGGCGLGYNVAALQRAGYQTTGIDFAPQTVSILQRVAPDLDIQLGDLRSLPFADNSFAGYWSLGVIEHFYSGYEPLAKEMARVIRPGGYLFLTFPYMSPLRRLKAWLGRYPALKTDGEPVGFYQFALDSRRVVAEFERLRFEKRYQTSSSGLKGFKDEVGLFRKPLQLLYNYPGRSVLLRGVRFLMEGFALLGAGHSCVLVLQKHGK